MIDNYPGHTVREYAEMQRSIALGTAAAVESLPMRLLETAREEDFIALVASVHRGIFRQAFGEDAGRFRRPGEDVHVGHEKHAFKGVDGARITQRLGAMWTELRELASSVLTRLSVINALALADAVLDDERVRLALEVREGGPHSVRRAIELAALVLADAAAVEARLAH